jgi:enamine deaminase RidA (YjgF/YER057c/UK114 family)
MSATSTDFEARVRELGLDIPDYSVNPYQGPTYGTMKAHHRVGNVLYLSGHVAEQDDDSPLYPGRVGDNVTIEQGYAAARRSACHCLANIRSAIGDLNGVVSVINSLNFVVCTPDFHDINLVSSGATDLFAEVFGEEVGLGGRATIGVTSLAHNHCFENWMTLEVKD